MAAAAQSLNSLAAMQLLHVCNQVLRPGPLPLGCMFQVSCSRLHNLHTVRALARQSSRHSSDPCCPPTPNLPSSAERLHLTWGSSTGHRQRQLQLQPAAALQQRLLRLL